MRIVFVHRTVNDYTVETPNMRGIGGTESALAYLSIELAKRGHAVSLLTNTSAPGRYRDVECLNYKTSLSPDLINASDVVVVSNEACGRTMKDEYRANKPLVMWNQHADDQPAIEALEFTRERKAWASIAFVSEWQRDQFCSIYWIDRNKSRVMRNAISPPFAAAAPAHPWFQSGQAPVLVYTSAPYRGLDVLLDAVPIIRSAISDMRLRVFSGMATLQVALEDDPYAELYRRCLIDRGCRLYRARPSTCSCRRTQPCGRARLPLDVSGNLLHRGDGGDVRGCHHPDDALGRHARDHRRLRLDDRAA